jgi:hypothetical protein
LYIFFYCCQNMFSAVQFFLSIHARADGGDAAFNPGS